MQGKGTGIPYVRTPGDVSAALKHGCSIMDKCFLSSNGVIMPDTGKGKRAAP